VAYILYIFKLFVRRICISWR